ncbi:MAG: AAA domain-containing protein [Bacteroidota bacterium]
MISTDLLLNHLELLALEKAEDLRQYQEKVLKRSLAERVKKGVSWYPVSLHRLYIGMGERVVVELENTEGKKNKPTAFQSGSMVALFGNLSDREAGRVSGVVASIRKGIIRIALSTDYIPEWIHHAKLGIDLEFDDKTYQEMVRALNQVIEPKKQKRLQYLREVMIGEVEPAFREWKEVRYQNPALNPSQNDAIQRVLEAEDVAIIHGPPGTGKTTTLVFAIQEILHHEHQVLVCAPSNTAVDLLCQKCAAQGIEVVRLGNPARVDENLQNLTLDGRISQHNDYAALRKLRKESEQIRKKALTYKRNFGPQERSKRGELLKEARELKQLAHQLEDYILHQVLRSAQVIATTLSGAARKEIEHKRFHTVLIDEAGQALAPACWIPILKADRVIMAGDHCQLPPTVKSFEAAKKGLDKTLFEHIIQRKEVDVMLTRQYRMPDSIMRFSGRQFYQDQLEADESVRYRHLGEGFPVFSFVDTAGCGFEERKNGDTQSTSNPEEAQILLKHLAIHLDKVSTEQNSLLEQDFSVGIISPYKDQVKVLKKQLLESPMLSDYEKWINIQTVDGFQGQEKDVIYISLVRSNTKGEIGFLKDIRRMNVALTRAKKMLVVVGDSSTIGNHRFYQAFLDYVEEIQAYRTAWEWMYDA